MGNFKNNKAIAVTKRRKYSNQNDNTAFSVIRINNMLIKNLGKRNDWVTITNTEFKSDRSRPEVKGVI